MARLGGVGHGDRVVRSAEPQRERLGRRAGRRHQAGHVDLELGRDSGTRDVAGQPRQGDRVDEGLHPGERGRRRNARQAAEFPVKSAFAGENVARRSAMDDADMPCRPGRIEAGIAQAFVLVFARQAADLGDDVGGGGDRIGAQRRIGGMRLMAGDNGAKGGDALVGVGDRHHRRFADDDQRRAADPRGRSGGSCRASRGRSSPRRSSARCARDV